MAKNKETSISIYGRWWVPVRKWFYPSWLFYELSARFYDYALAVQTALLDPQGWLAVYLGPSTTQALALFCSLATFLLCTGFLSIAACLSLYRFFVTPNLSGLAVEPKLKKYL